MLVAFLCGIIVLAGYFLDQKAVTDLAAQIVRWRIVIAAFALALGGVNMLRLHGQRVAQQKNNWPYSLIFIVSFFLYFVLGVTKSPTSSQYQYIWQNLYQPASSTMYSFTLFYMTSACWRAFRIRNWQAAVLLVVGVVVLLGQVGLGSAISPAIPKISDWIVANPSAAGIRAITIGGSLGMVMMSIRVILGLERTYMPGGNG
ncbi:MAG: hypothetical protein ACOX3V_02740 [Bacillota bacterium]